MFIWSSAPLSDPVWWKRWVNIHRKRVEKTDWKVVDNRSSSAPRCIIRYKIMKEQMHQSLVLNLTHLRIYSKGIFGSHSRSKITHNRFLVIQSVFNVGYQPQTFTLTVPLSPQQMAFKWRRTKLFNGILLNIMIGFRPEMTILFEKQKNGNIAKHHNPNIWVRWEAVCFSIKASYQSSDD